MKNKTKHTYIIAEAGVNHNGNFQLAKQLVDAAVESGADCIKFQTFVPENIVSRYAEKSDYQKRNTESSESQLSMLQKLTLTSEDFYKLAEYAAFKKIDFCSTAFDDISIQLIHELKCKFWKIPSGEVTNLPYLLKIAQYNEPIMMSTGMCNLKEIADAVKIIREITNAPLILLHCNTQYPTPISDVNLLAMLTMQRELGLPVGYSDHTLGIEVALAAVALGACVIEKHFTLDKAMEGPDHRASLEPQELKQMIKGIRKVEFALGSKEKQMSSSEQENVIIARKSIVAAQSIRKDEQFTEKNLTVKRPGTGISPMKWDEIIGKTANRDYKVDEMIQI